MPILNEFLPFRTKTEDLLSALDGAPGTQDAYSLGAKRAHWTSLLPEAMIAAALLVVLGDTSRLALLYGFFLGLLITVSLILGIKRGRYYYQLVIPYLVGFSTVGAIAMGLNLESWNRFVPWVPITALLSAAIVTVFIRTHQAFVAGCFDGIELNDRSIGSINFSACTMRRSVLQHVTFEACDLSHMHLMDSRWHLVNLYDCACGCTEFSSSSFVQCDWRRSKLLNVRAVSCRFVKCDFRESTTVESRMQGSVFEECLVTANSFDTRSLAGTTNV